MSVSSPTSASAASQQTQTAAPRAPVRPEDRDAWAANLINEMRRAARTQGGPRSL